MCFYPAIQHALLEISAFLDNLSGYTNLIKPTFLRGNFPASHDYRRVPQAQCGCFDHISVKDPAHQIAMAGDGGLSFLRRQGGVTNRS